MKKILLAAIFMLVAQIGTAQVSDAFKADVKKLLDISGANEQMDAVKKQILEIIPAEKQADFSKEFESALAPLVRAQQDFYTKEFTHDDIKQMVKFYESPAGKKYVQNVQKLEGALGQLSEDFSNQIEQLVNKYRG
jgi:hypothetical protein